MNIVAAILFLAVAVFAGSLTVGAAMSYEETRHAHDGYGAFVCGVLALAFAFVAGLLL